MWVDELKEYVYLSKETWSVPGVSMAIINDKEVECILTLGNAVLETNEIVDVSSLFPLGCCTKTFSALLISIIAEKYRISLDIPIKHYLKDLVLYDEILTNNTTIRDIVLMRTGIPMYTEIYEDENASFEKINLNMHCYKPVVPFRSRFIYSVLYHNLLPLITGELLHADWGELLTEYIFTPLNMNNVSFNSSNKKVAQPYLCQANKIIKTSMYDYSNVAPAAALSSDINSLIRYIHIFLNNGSFEGRYVISTNIIKKVLRPQIYTNLNRRYHELSYQSYCLGWFYEPYRGIDLFYHEGNARGYSVIFCLIPEFKKGVIILTNMNNNYLPRSVLYFHVDQLLGVQRLNWNRRFKREQLIKEII